MPRFRFGLDPLLEMRRREERSCMGEFAKIEQQRASAEHALRHKQAEISAGRDALRAGLVGKLDMTLLRQQAAASVAVDRVARQTVLQLAGLARQSDAARAKLVQASQRRRAVEILRERRLEEWKQEADRKETAFLDDLSNIAAAREAAGTEGAASKSDPTR
jgi:flagellar export protein FliJ